MTCVKHAWTKFLTLCCAVLCCAEQREAFALFDKKGDGLVASSEIGSILRALGLNPSESSVKKIKAQLGVSRRSILCDWLHFISFVLLNYHSTLAPQATSASRLRSLCPSSSQPRV